MKIRFTLILLFVSIFSIAQSLNHILIPGTSFYMVPPSDFELAKGFKGFLHKSSGALIMVNEIEAPYSQILGRFSKAALEIKEMTEVGRQEIKLSNTDATLITVTQRENGIDNYKKMLLFGEGLKTLLVTAVYPESNPELGAGIKRTLLTTIYNQPAHFPHLSAIKFNLKIPGSTFKLTRYVDSSLIYTCDGRLPTTGPYLVVHAQMTQVNANDRGKYCLDQLKQHLGTDSLDVKSSGEFTADDMPGYEIIAERKARNGSADLVYQAILFEKKAGNYAIFGLAPNKIEDNVISFRSIVKSLRRGPFRTRVPEQGGDTVVSYRYALPTLDHNEETTAERSDFCRKIWKDEGRWISHSFYKTGEREMVAIYLDDSLKIREGLCFRWYKNGQLADSTFYLKGKLEGHQTWYYENGQKSEEGIYAAGDPKNVMFWTEGGARDSNGASGVNMPSFKGEPTALQDFLVKNLKYPESARYYHQQGRSVIKFDITADGKIMDARIVRSSGVRDLDYEALRVIELMPDWNAASNHNRRSQVPFLMPITFKLD